MTPAGMMPEFDAVILAGGAAARMGGADKPALDVGGQALVVTVAQAAVAAGTRRLIVVGPERGGAVGSALAAVGALTVRESPPGSGPVPALRRGLAEVTARWVVVLAADLPFLTGAWLAALLSGAQSAGQPGAVLTDDGGVPQWLAGCWRTAALRAALASYRGQSLGGLMRPLQPVFVGQETTAPARGPGERQPEAAPPWLDCDDPVQLTAARAIASGRHRSEDGEA
jgi:molybdenum cofactor guanylyltransferase